MNIKLFKQKGTNGINIMVVSDDRSSFLLSDQYHFVLSWESYRITNSDEKIELYELLFNEELKGFVISKIIKGIFQYRILSIPTMMSINRKEFKLKYKEIKEIYKELKNLNITKKLSFKEKLITIIFA